MDLRDLKEFIKDASSYIITAVAIFLIVVYVISFHQVIGPSMDPTLIDSDVLLVNKLGYHIIDLKRFEIIEFKHNEKIYIKRIIGLPGENISYKDGNLYVNDTLVGDSFSNITNDFSLAELGYTKIPEDYYLVLGDNRVNSEDSREIGLIPKNEIIGRTLLRIWPFNRIGIVK